jgi:putative mRNA 3-end processing factor
MVIIIKNLMKIKFLGGAREVGRSGIAVKGGRTQVLVDYGVMIGREPGFPMHVRPNEVDGIVLTHAHLDHSGAVPFFHITGDTPVYGTQPTFDLANLLIKDFIHLSRGRLPYEIIELQNMMKYCRDIGFRAPTRIRGMKIELLDSGHIPGGAQAIVERRGKRLLYTSDFNTVDTKLLKGADQAYDGIDALVMESTYADEDHQDRASVEKKFIDKVNAVVEGGGTVLVPAFSVGRSQEILCLLAAHHFEYPVFVDGMAKAANDILMKHLAYLRDGELFMEAVHMANKIGGWRERKNAVKRPGVIVSPAGMLKGGNAVFYMNTIAEKEANAVLLVSYQVPGTPGSRLMATKKFIIGGKTRKVKADIDHFDFTSHSGRSQLLETVKKVGDAAKVFVMHGAEENCQGFAEAIRTEVGLEAIAPKTGEVYQV